MMTNPQDEQEARWRQLWENQEPEPVESEDTSETHVDYAPETSYWDNPQRVAQYANVIESAPPGWTPPPWMDAQKIVEARDELAKANDYNPWYDWTAISPNDPLKDLLRSIPEPPNEARFPTEQEQNVSIKLPSGGYFTGPKSEAVKRIQQDIETEQGKAETMPFGAKAEDWDKLEPWQQLYLSVFAPQSQVQGRPEASKVTASMATALPAGMSAFFVGSAIGTPVVGALAGLATFGAMTYQNYTGQQIPVMSDILNVLNLPAEGVERSLGVIQQALSSDTGLQKVLSNLPAAWKAAHLTYETGDLTSGAMNVFAKASTAAIQGVQGKYLSDPLYWAAALTGIGQPAYYAYKAITAPVETAGKGEVWQVSKGYTKPVALVGPRSMAAIEEARERIAGGEDPTLVWADFQDRFGDSGTFGDFVAQTVLDPMNLIPLVEGKAGAKISKALGRPELAKAFERTSGKWYMDALPFGVQQLAEALTGEHSSQGALTALKTYREMLRSGQVAKPSTGWGWFDKTVGGLTQEGKFGDLQPVEKPNLIQYLKELNPDAKATLFLNTLVDNVGARIYGIEDDAADPMRKAQTTADFIREVGGTSARATGLAGQEMLDSPATATTQAAVNAYVKTGTLDRLLAEWVSSQPKRSDLLAIAGELGLEPGKLLERIADNPQEIYDLMLTKPGLKTLTDKYQAPKVMADWFAQFTGKKGDGKAIPQLAWDVRDWQARVMLSLTDYTEGWLVDYYHLKPQSSLFRVGNLLKQAQSMLLLDLNPRYLMNNAINNWVTRAADGTFGFMTKKQIDTWFDRFGVKPQRISEGIGPGGMTRQEGFGKIEKAMASDDALEKASRTLRKWRGKAGLMSRVSGALESSESRQAFTIALQRAWDQTWKRGESIPLMSAPLETMLRRINPDLPDVLYRAVEAGVNMNEIENAIYGEAIKKTASNYIDQAAATIAPGHEQAARELWKTTGLDTVLEEALAKAQTPEQVDVALDTFKQTVQNIIDERTDRDLIDVAESIKDVVKNEGWTAAMKVFTDYQLGYWELWDRHFDRIDELEKRTANDPAARSAAWRAQRAWDKIAFRRANDYETQVMRGLFDALGIQNEPAQNYLLALERLQTSWRDAYQGYEVDPVTKVRLTAEELADPKRAREHVDGRDDAWDRFFNTNYDSTEARNVGYAEAKAKVKDLMDTATRNETAIRAEMDTLFVDVWRAHSGEIGATGAAIWRKQVSNIRDEMIREREAFYAAIESEKLDPETLRQRHEEFWQKTYKPMIAKLISAEVSGAHTIAPQGQTRRVARGTATVKVRAHAADRANAAAAEKVVKQAQARMTRAEMRKELQQAFGSTDAELDAAMLTIDMHAERWAAERPGLTADDWYAQRIAGVEGGNKAAGLLQETANTAKGSVYFLDDGRAVIRAFKSSDVSTVMHELGHVFRRDLIGDDLDAIAKWYGFKDAAELANAQTAFDRLGELQRKGENQWTPEEKAEYTTLSQDGAIKKYVKGEEDFARAWERYLAEGKAPTSKLEAVFKQFTNWLLRIYAKVTGQDVYGKSGILLNESRSPLAGVNLETRLSNGKYLRDVFDQMLVEERHAVEYRSSKGERYSDTLRQKYPEYFKGEETKPYEPPAPTEAQKAANELAAKLAQERTAKQDALTTKPLNQWDANLREAVTTAVYELREEAEYAERGQRIFNEGQTGSDLEVIGIKSTYPKWWNDVVGGLTYRGETGRTAVLIAIDDMLNGNEAPAQSKLVQRLKERVLLYAQDEPALRLYLGDAPYDTLTKQAAEIPDAIELVKGEYQRDVKRAAPDALRAYTDKLERLSDELLSIMSKVIEQDKPATPGAPWSERAQPLIAAIERAQAAIDAALDDPKITEPEPVKEATVLPTNLNTLFKLAEEYGIHTADKNGKPMDRHLLNTINKYGDTKFTRLADVPVEAVKRALEARKQAHEKPAEAVTEPVKEVVTEPVTEPTSKVDTEEIGDWIYYRYNRNLYRAPKGTPFGTDGFPQGGRFEAPSHMADEALKMARESVSEPVQTEPMRSAGYKREIEDATGRVRYVLTLEDGSQVESAYHASPDDAIAELRGKGGEAYAELLKAVDAAEEYVPIQPREIGGKMVKNAIRRDGKIVAYVEDKPSLRAIDGQRILGIDPEKPGEYIYEDAAGKLHSTGDGNAAELRQEASSQVDTPEFRRWFGDSKVVDENGQPLVVYHGTDADFTTFDTSMAGRNFPEGGDAGTNAVYFTTDPSEASDIPFSYERPTNTYGQNVMPVYLKIENPLEYEYDGSKAQYDWQREPTGVLDQIKDKLFVAYVDGGHDGIIVRDTSTGKATIVVTDNTRIKSVFNRGTFDPDNPSILMQESTPTVPLGATPVPLHEGAILDEIEYQKLTPMVEQIRNDAKADLNKRPVKFADLPETEQAGVRDWIAQVRQNMGTAKYGAMRYGEMMRDQSMLNYRKQTGADNILNLVYPYQFWYTRTMLNWGQRMIDKPTWFSFYARLKQAQEKNEQKGMPSRLSGKMRLPAPYLPSWMGGGYWFDPLSQLFPFDAFGQPLDTMRQDKARQAQQTITMLREWEGAGKITTEEMNDAITKRTGATWELAWTQAQADSDTGNPFNMVGMMMGPALYVSIPLNALGIAAPGVKGKPEAISPTPGAQTAAGFQAITKGTPLEMLGSLVGMTARPEQWVRQKLGLPEFGEFTDFYIDRQLANLVAEGLATPREAEIAMIDRSGRVYEQALDRVRQEQGLRQAGMLPIKAALSGGSVSDVATATLATPFSGSILPEGEVKLRELRGQASAAYAAKEAGDTEAVGKFYDENPEYSIRSYQYDTPDERLRRFLQSEVWTRWQALPDLYKTEASKGLGQEFQTLFLNKDTRDYERIPTETYAAWAKALAAPGTKPGELPQSVKTNAAYVQYSPLDDANLAQQYKTARDKLFPGMMDALNAYYNLPDEQREKLYANSPALRQVLTAYNTWKDTALATNPKLIPLVGGSGELSQLPVETQQVVYQYRAAKARQFPNVDSLQEQYFALPEGTKRSQFLAQNEELSSFWDWREKVAAQYPKASPYILSEASLSSKILGQGTPKRSAEEEAVTKAYYSQRDRLFPKIAETFETFYDLPADEQKRVRKQHPEIDKYYAWKNEYLAKNPAAIPLVTGKDSELSGLPVEITWSIYQYRAARDRLYPDLNQEQDEYFSLDTSKRSAYLKQHPDLAEYWDWREKMAAAQPKIAPYLLSEDTLKEKILAQAPKTSTLNASVLAQFSPELIQALTAAAYANRNVGEGAYLELKKAWNDNGQPYGSVNDWIQRAVLPTFRAG